MKLIVSFCFIVFGLTVFGQNDTAYIRTFGTAQSDEGKDIIISKDSNYVFLSNTSNFSNSNDIQIVKADKDFNVIQTVVFSSPENEKGNKIIQLVDSSFIVVGIHNTYGSGGYDGFLLKIDKNFNKLWEASVGSDGWDELLSVSSQNDTIFASGYYQGSCGKAGQLIKISSNNGKIIEKKEVCLGIETTLNEIIFHDNKLVICGSYVDSILETYQGYIAYYDKELNPLNEKIFGGDLNEEFVEIFKDFEGNILTGGYSDSPGISLEGGEDFLLVKYDSSLNLIHSRTYGSTDDDRLEGINQGKNGNYFISGTSFGGFGLGGYGMRIIETSNALSFLDGPTFGDIDDEYGVKVINSLDTGFVYFGNTDSYDLPYKDVYIVEIKSENIDAEYELKIKNSSLSNSPIISKIPEKESTEFIKIESTNSNLKIFNNGNSSLKLNIFSITGQLLHETIIHNVETIQLDSFNSGIYFIELKNDESRKVVKFFK